MIALLILSLASLMISLFTVGIIKQRFSQQLLDIPNERSSHTQPTPRGGGLGFILAFGITSTIFAYTPLIKTVFGFSQNLSTEIFVEPAIPVSQLWLVLIPLTVVGIIDDRGGVPAAIRYLIQLLAASIAVFYFGSFPQPWLAQFGIVGEIIAILLTVIGMTALINFYNFMDGLDGLVAGVTAVQLSFLAFWFNLPLLWLLVAALLGFLYWNWSPAKIFMGDAGSTVLGATVAIALLNNGNDPARAWSALTITLPLIGDAIYTLTRRLIKRENIFQAHRSHLYQRLQQAGWSHATVTIAYISATVAISSALAALGSIGTWLSLAVVILAIILGEVYLRRASQSERSPVNYS